MNRVNSLTDNLSRRFGLKVAAITPLAGGCIGSVWRVDLIGGGAVVAKAAGSSATLDIEAFMLGYLATHSALPVPKVLLCEPDVLVMEYIPGQCRFGPAAQAHAAHLLADLHTRTWNSFGFERDTLIGSLHQPNTPTVSWIEFFREHRLLHMARAAHAASVIDDPLLARIERLADSLSRLLNEPAQPSLIHGDIWTTNVLALGDRIAAFLDPAIYYADSEIELAFITLFDTFDEPFFRAYQERRPIRAGFFETRRHVHNLYPLLVHTRLFGRSYMPQVAGTLARLGF